ncbi:MAG: hypothetical protein KAX19_10940 [Candidatus Brocadiae bacterium]|nr:hypothetical protein [Candidatus Brocadiia bacterium]
MADQVRLCMIGAGGHASRSIYPYFHQGFVGELREFVAAIREGRQPESSIAQATHRMAIYDAIRRSVQAGTPVQVEAV